MMLYCTHMATVGVEGLNQYMYVGLHYSTLFFLYLYLSRLQVLTLNVKLLYRIVSYVSDTM